MPGHNEESSRPWVAGFEVKDCALVAIATGHRARSLRELRDEIETIDVAAIYFHFWGGLLRPTFDDPRYYNGFAIWAAHALGNAALAEKLSVIDPTEYPDMQGVREKLLSVTDEELAYTDGDKRVPADAGFEFVRSQIVVFRTDKTLTDPTELAHAVAAMSRTSVFYHFVDARRRTPDSVDDFTTWLTDIQRDEHRELCRALAAIDPFFDTLSETRSKLASTFEKYLGA